MFAGDDVKTNDLELYFWKVVRCKCFCKKLYFAYWDLFIRKVLLERYLLERIKSSLRRLQFTVGQKHNLVGHLVLPRIYPFGQNVRCAFRLVGQFLILVGHCPMSDRYFKSCIGGGGLTFGIFAVMSFMNGPLKTSANIWKMIDSELI